MRLRTCTICGQQYDACKTPAIAEGYFRWQDIACSPKCAMEYLAQKEAEQNAAPAEVEPVIDADEAQAPKKVSEKGKKSAPTTKEKVETQPD